jgi:hypothetical protein
MARFNPTTFSENWLAEEERITNRSPLPSSTVKSVFSIHFLFHDESLRARRSVATMEENQKGIISA